jgi:hypothetical protein
VDPQLHVQQLPRQIIPTLWQDALPPLSLQTSMEASQPPLVLPTVGTFIFGGTLSQPLIQEVPHFSSVAPFLTKQILSLRPPPTYMPRWALCSPTQLSLQSSFLSQQSRFRLYLQHRLARTLSLPRHAWIYSLLFAGRRLPKRYK